MYTAILCLRLNIWKVGGFWLAVSFFINWYECFSYKWFQRYHRYEPAPFRQHSVCIYGPAIGFCEERSTRFSAFQIENDTKRHWSEIMKVCRFPQPLSPSVLHLRHCSFCLLDSSSPLCLKVPSKKISSDSTYILISITKHTVQPAVKEQSGLAGSVRLHAAPEQTFQRSSGTRGGGNSLQGRDHVGSPRATFIY